MALKTFVKVSTVNNLSDARYCAGMEVDLIGFSLEKENPNYISPESYKELTEWLSGPQYVGEFENYSSDEIIETLQSYNIDLVQTTDVNQLEKLKNLDLPIILKSGIDELGQLPVGLDITYLLITSADDKISTEQISKLQEIAAHYNVLLASGINEKNVEAVIKEAQVTGIALQGGDELRPGYKDYDELADILEALEEEDF